MYLNEIEFDGGERAAAGINKIVDLATKATIAVTGKLKQTRKEKAEETKKQLAAAKAATEGNFDELVASIVLGRNEPSDDDFATFDYVGIEELNKFEIYLGALIKNFDQNPEILKKAIIDSDFIINDSDRNQKYVTSLLNFTPESSTKFRKYIQTNDFSARQIAFWKSMFNISDSLEAGRLMVNRIKEIATRNQATNLANTSKPGNVARAEGESLLPLFAVELGLIQTRLLDLKSLLPEIEKRPRLSSDDVQDEPEKSVSPVTSHGSEPTKKIEPEYKADLTSRDKVDRDSQYSADFKSRAIAARAAVSGTKSPKPKVKYNAAQFANKRVPATAS